MLANAYQHLQASNIATAWTHTHTPTPTHRRWRQQQRTKQAGSSIRFALLCFAEWMPSEVLVVLLIICDSLHPSPSIFIHSIGPKVIETSSMEMERMRITLISVSLASRCRFALSRRAELKRVESRETKGLWLSQAKPNWAGDGDEIIVVGLVVVVVVIGRGRGSK